jgi:hypothetical protein
MKKLLCTGPSPRGWHRLQLALECTQKYAFHYEMELGNNEGAKKDSLPLVKGSMLHLALAHHYKRLQAVQQGNDPEEWEEPVTALRRIAEMNGRVWSSVLQNCIETYHAYCDRWSSENLKILEVERMAYTKIGPYLFTGRFDLIYEDRRGKVFVMDHKTTGRIYASQKKFYGISGQLTGYSYLGYQIYGNRFAGLVLNQIQHKEPFKFLRLPLPPAPHLLTRFPQIVQDAEDRIESVRKTGRPPTNWPMAANELTCFSRYGACPYLDRCRWGMEEKS